MAQPVTPAKVDGLNSHESKRQLRCVSNQRFQGNLSESRLNARCLRSAACAASSHQVSPRNVPAILPEYKSHLVEHVFQCASA